MPHSISLASTVVGASSRSRNFDDGIPGTGHWAGGPDVRGRTLIATLVCLFCFVGSCAYVVERSDRMEAEKVRCCYAAEAYAFWNGMRAITHGLDPYSDEVTRQNDIYYFGGDSGPLGFEPQRFAYPVSATVPLLPLGRVTFRNASVVMLVTFGMLLCVGIACLRGSWDTKTVFYTAFAFCSYPVFYDWISLQPTIFFLTLAVISLGLFRARYSIASAAALVLALGKPHIALPIILPMLIATVVEWRERKSFAVWTIAFAVGLVSVSMMLRPNWIKQWLAVARAYNEYSPHSLMRSWLGAAGPAASVALVVAVVVLLWLRRRADLLQLAAISTVLLFVVMPYRTYNAACFVVPLVWVADNIAAIKASGAIHQMAVAAVQVAVVALWVLTAAAALLLHAGGSYWQTSFMLPVAGVRILLYALLLMVAVCCFARAELNHTEDLPVSA